MIRNLQALRALAAMMVVFVHLQPLLATISLPEFGRAGVDLFFVISGFVMVHTTRTAPPTAFDFARNRVARIVPIYWVMTFAVFAIAWAAPALVGGTKPIVGQLLMSMLFVPFVKASGLVQPVLFVGWTLNYEMFFYALFAIGLATGRYYAGMALVAVILIAIVVSGHLLHPTGVPAKFYSNPIVLEFAAGMGLALLTDLAPRSVSAGARLIAWLSLLAIPVLIAGPILWPDAPRLLVCGSAACVLVAGAVLLERWGWRIDNGAVLRVGDASYVLYLSHPYIAQLFTKLTARLHPTGLLSIALILICLGLVVAAALALHAWLERPLWRLARRLLMTERLPARPA